MKLHTMKRKVSTEDNDESRLSSLLFNKSKKFAENLLDPVKDEGIVGLNPVWTDEDDRLHGNDINPNIKSDGLYVQQLKKRYETLVGTPNWAKLKMKTEENDDDETELLRTVGHLQKPESYALRKDLIQIQSLSIVNKETRNEGPILTNVKFHPKMSVVLVAGLSGKVSLFSITGEYTKLHSFKLKKWKVGNVHFKPDGSLAYLSTNMQSVYCVYDLVTAVPNLVQFPSIVKRPKIFEMSPDGKLFAVSECYTEVYIICAESKELLRSLKLNSNVAAVTFTSDSANLICYGVEGEVSMWNLSTYRVSKKFQDHGCVTASCITTSPCGNLIAMGSGEGIVNIYDSANITSSDPVPLKTISHLKTKITSLEFNATSEILSLSSSLYPDALKFVHLPSYHVFNNFPRQSFGCICTLSFSPNSGYFAIGNNTNKAFLFRLRHFKNY